MKTAVIALYKVFPPESGGAAVSYGLADHLGGQVHLFQLAETDGTVELRAGLTLVSIRAAGASRAAKARSLRAALSSLRRRIAEVEPDLAIIEGSSWAVYHRLLFRSLKRARPDMPVIYHMHNVETLLRRRQDGPLVAWATRVAEGRMVRDCGLVLACSQDDADRIRGLFGIRPRVLPNGIDPDRFSRVTAGDVDRVRKAHDVSGPCVLFMGLPEYPPNREGLEFLRADVFPRLVKRIPEARLVVIGGTVAWRAPWLVNPGRVPYEDVPAILRACDVCVAPIFSGSGTRVKILEALAARRPVVSTTKGLEGIAAAPGEQVEIADDGEAFSERIAGLLADPARARALGEAGRRLVEESFSWPALARRFWEYVAEAGLALPEAAKLSGGAGDRN